MKVAVVGASDKPEKYSYMAVKLLQEKGHEVFPIHPTLASIEGTKVYPSLAQLPAPVHTVSMYVSAAVSAKLGDEISHASPKRVIFNPGAENTELEVRLKGLGIQTVEGCTLVMLKTGQF